MKRTATRPTKRDTDWIEGIRSYLIPALNHIQKEQPSKPSSVIQEYQMLAMNFDRGRTHCWNALFLSRVRKVLFGMPTVCA